MNEISRRAQAPRLSYMVARLDRLVRARISESLRPHGVSVPQYTALGLLADRPELSNAQLARRSYITAQAMHQMLGGLEERGLIVRTASPDHGVIRLTRLTTEGEDLLVDCDRAVDQVESEVFGALDEAERQVLHGLLGRTVVAAHSARPTNERGDKRSRL